jgi:hypothetical protein
VFAIEGEEVAAGREEPQKRLLIGERKALQPSTVVGTGPWEILQRYQLSVCCGNVSIYSVTFK